MSTGDEGQGAFDRRTVLQSMGAATVAAGAGQAAFGTVGAVPSGDDPPTARGSVEQVLVTDVVPGATVRLYEYDDGDTELVAEGDARFPDDPLDWFVSASFVFREPHPEGLFLDYPDVELVPGQQYTVTQVVDDSESPHSDPVTVLDDEHPEPGSERYEQLYESQTLEATVEGEIGYMQTRDDTDLAYQIRFPPAEVREPPYPTIVIYSGYAPSVSLPGDEVVIDRLVNEEGLALVAIQKRGTQCSSGKFDFFEKLQIIDTYDIIETVASQEWAGNVGMAGGSYSGYSQFFAASTQPPSLEAIAPGMPVGDFYRDVGYTGGILNPMFAAAWAASRDDAARHDTDGRGDTTTRVHEDQRCMDNQVLRSNNEPTMLRLRQSPHMVDFYEDRSPWELASDIEVPTLLNLSWQDEQTGSRPTRIQEQIPDDVPVQFVAGNGDHNIYLADDVVEDLLQFFTYYLLEEVPEGDLDEFDEEEYDQALEAYETEDLVKIYWEMDQNLHPRAVSTYDEWPPAETWDLYFQPDGSLAEEPPAVGAASRTYEYRPSPAPRHLVDRDDDGRLMWDQKDEESYAAFVSEELDEDRVCLGSGLAELWLNSTIDDTDLEVTITEVRPDGTEQYIQSGWLRASHRAEDEDLALPRRPWHTHTEEDAELLPDDGYAHMRVEFHPFGHIFREGSRIKIALENPGGNRDLWGFTVVNEEAENEVATSAVHPSKVELPLIEGESTDTLEPAGDIDLSVRPDCGEVRNEPCREFTPDIGLPPVVEGENPPRDLDEDGLYESIRGTDDPDMRDVQVLFENLDSDAVQHNAWAYNFSGTNPDRVSVFDVQALFNRLKSGE